MRENADRKGRRYLTEGRLSVQWVDGTEVRATCRGAGHVYRLGFSPESWWWCSCAARTRCAHLVALQSVVVRPHPARWEDGP